MGRFRLILIACLAISTIGIAHFAFAEGDVKSMQKDIADKKAQAENIQKEIDSYRAKIKTLDTQAASLLNDIALIENQTALLELEIQGTQADIDGKNLELQLIANEIEAQTASLEKQKELLGEMIFELQKNQGIEVVDVLFNAENFDELFAHIEELETLNANLGKAVASTKETKNRLQDEQTKQEEGLADLLAMQDELKTEQGTLDQQKNAKDVLVQKTQSSEAQYRVLMSELRQEEQSVTNELSMLQNELEQRLSDQDNDGLDIAPSLSAPMQGTITAIFHDPTYPFKKLFGQHSGIDIATSYGTPIKAAAPGIVAWTRTGASYGNYVMIVHEGGLATLYAHMSGFNVEADQFVERGDVIGYEGSTGFSTGPHLHFEVRLNGIPVNPEDYISF
ncbi:MAG: peptidoglycan DD-metalloendopeptidase family protein [Patescibacteria group bacterium]|jgi:murein DD-endopeptidase MepM/ murein hydrolase activator NlpD